ncbi:alpha-1-inhibitor 3-like [Tachypleus tridentatus]|uniref:alpha-1-inhibitor 3-like n=1 Tax=Tachypleus tridentatus TaxID=6853 RepID=UPI003FD414A0
MRIGVKDNDNGNVIAETVVSFSKERDNRILLLNIPPKVVVKQPRLFVYGFYAHSRFNDFSYEKSIRLEEEKIIIFIQTDKPIYKPGETVKVRVLPTTHDLKLLPRTTIGHFQIENPNGIVLGIWPTLSFVEGIAQFELDLPDEPTYGFWHIKGNIDNVQISWAFEVKEYVLPKFEVKIIPPPYLLSDAEFITWEICANYTYGQPVEGTIVIETSVVKYNWEKKPVPVVHHSGPIVGCFTFTVNSSAIGFNETRLRYRPVTITAEVTEKGTDIKMNASRSISRIFYPFTIHYVQPPTTTKSYLKPGLPFYGELKVQKPDGSPAPHEPIEICMYTRREVWNIERLLLEKSKTCKSFTSDQVGIIQFTVPPQTPDVISLRFKAKSLRYEQNKAGDNDNKLKQPEYSFIVSSWYSPSGSHLQLEPITETIECGKYLGIKIKYTTRGEKKRIFYYKIMARNNIVDAGSFQRKFLKKDDKSGETDETYFPYDTSVLPLHPPNEPEWENYVNIPPFIGEITLKFMPTFKMNPVARIIVFYVREDGETVADSTIIGIKKCLPNKVDLKFKEEKVTPGATATLQLTASPYSVCGIGAVDKSVYLLSSDNRITEEEIFRKLGGHMSYYWPPQATPDHEYCKNYVPKHPVSEEKMIYPPVFSSIGYLDTIYAFDEAGLLVISDMELETRPCKPQDFEDIQRPCFYDVKYFDEEENIRGPLSPPQPGSPAIPEEPVVAVRTDFRETWLWELQHVGTTGELCLKRNIPHTITEWVASAICISEKTGLGVSEAATVKGFQPFFVSLTLPYSVIRGEKVPIIVTVFNYLNESLGVELSLEQSEDFDLENFTSAYTSCVLGGRGDTTRWIIRPKSLGQVNLTVYGASLPYRRSCGSHYYSTITVRDAVTRQLLVEPEGYPKEETWSAFLCSEAEGITATSELVSPNDLVEGSLRGYVSVTGDLMGPSIKNLDRLVELPTGCGEQNMVKFVPNIFVLDYLRATGNITYSIQKEALNNMRKGYAGQLKYRHPDGSYSAFGKRDKEGSTFLTAFVYRSFFQAQRFILIKKYDLTVTENWILSKQRPNGCFIRVGKTLQSALMGGLSHEDETPAPLTAYVLISLLEAGYKNDTVIDQGIRCLNALSNPSTYSLALFAYATSLADHSSARNYLRLLEERATTEGGKTFWKSPTSGPYSWGRSVSVEIAGYAILTLLQNRSASDMAKVTPIIRWLAQQQNYRGGFFSTQDTVVALQAMAKFATIAYRHDLYLRVEIESTGFKREITLNKDNSILMHTFRIPTVPSHVEFEATGRGCCLVQTSLRYNVYTPPPRKGFHLYVTVKTDMYQDYNNAHITICVSYDGKTGVSNMAVLEMKMVSGWIPDETSIEKLLTDERLNISYYEVDGNQLNLYFSELTQEQDCFTFYLNQETDVQETKPAYIWLYDYYELEQKIVTTYTIGENIENLRQRPRI